MAEHLMSTYARLPVTFARGSGAWLWDDAGNQYLDALSGIAVCGLGHAHPAITEALCRQAGELIHTSNLYRNKLQETLATELTRVAEMESAFFCNSGAEAAEAAIKLARLYGHQRDISQPAIIVAENSFHGRTLATLSATGNRRVQAGFEPLVQGFVRVAYNDVEALRTVARNTNKVVAVLLEPIQGEGGIIMPDDDYLRAVRALCDEYGWLLMLDEIQTGMGRTGRWFACQHLDVRADVIAVAKALGNGVPIGACVARGAAAQVFKPGNHGSTFGGNALACSAALAVIRTMEKEGLVERAATLGDYLMHGLQEALAGHAAVREIRGRGLMIGIELAEPCTALPTEALARGILFSVQAEKVIRLLPPLTLSDAEADTLIERVAAVIRDHFG